MGAFSGRGREPGGSSPPTSLAHWLPMVYVVLLGSRRWRIGGARANRRSSAPLLFSALPLAGVPREPGKDSATAARARRKLSTV